MPRFLGCLLLIPALTIMADFMGVVGGYLYSIHILHIDEHHYWKNSENFVQPFDLFIQQGAVERDHRLESLVGELLEPVHHGALRGEPREPAEPGHEGILGEVAEVLQAAGLADLSPALREKPPRRAGRLREAVRRFETGIILDALERHHGNVARAAAELGMTRQALWDRIRRLRITAESA